MQTIDHIAIDNKVLLDKVWIAPSEKDKASHHPEMVDLWSFFWSFFL